VVPGDEVPPTTRPALRVGVGRGGKYGEQTQVRPRDGHVQEVRKRRRGGHGRDLGHRVRPPPGVVFLLGAADDWCQDARVVGLGRVPDQGDGDACQTDSPSTTRRAWRPVGPVDDPRGVHHGLPDTPVGRLQPLDVQRRQGLALLLPIPRGDQREPRDRELHKGPRYREILRGYRDSTSRRLVPTGDDVAPSLLLPGQGPEAVQAAQLVALPDAWGAPAIGEGVRHARRAGARSRVRRTKRATYASVGPDVLSRDGPGLEGSYVA